MFAMPATLPKIVNDFNADLVEVYEVVRDSPEELIHHLKQHHNSKEHFLKVRAWDRSEDFLSRLPAERAARFIFLNRTCFNGLYRVNSKGHFNVPFGNYVKPDWVLSKTIEEASKFLGAKSSDGVLNTSISTGDYRKVTAQARKGDFVYLDPPYDPISTTASFVGYQQDGFGRDDQLALRDEVVRLTKKGVPVMLSNSDTEFIRDLYSDMGMFAIEFLRVSRNIGASASSRSRVGEVLVNNFGALN